VLEFRRLSAKKDVHKTQRRETVMSSPKGEVDCVAFCPTNVLEMDLFVVKAAKPEACIACMQCELRCPDFAIKIHKIEDK
jgi:2-oxoglutarate ferredoxin oxidoreductase subunit delta